MGKDNDLNGILEAAGAVGQVKHTDFAPFITMIERKKKDDQGKWVASSKPYMGSDGRVTMARRDHALQVKRLDITTSILYEDERLVRLQATVVSEIYGTVTAFAESHLGGGGVEAQHPIEVGETSAISRALGLLGYGVLPGSGLASAEDMERATREDEAPAQQKPRRAASKPAQQAEGSEKAADDAPLGECGRSALLVAFGQKHGMSVQVAAKELDNLCREEYGVAVSGLTTAQGRDFWQSLKLSAASNAKPPEDTDEAAGATGYLDDSTNRRRVLADVRENRLADDPEATVAGWQAKGMEREEVEAALDVLRSDKWRKRYFAGLKEMKVTAERAKVLLRVEHIAELYERNIEDVLALVREGAEQADA